MLPVREAEDAGAGVLETAGAVDAGASGSGWEETSGVVPDAGSDAGTAAGAWAGSSAADAADSGSSAAALSYSEGAMLTAETADIEDAADFCRAVHAEKSPARTSRKTRMPNTYQRVRGENELGLETVEDAETMRG